MIKAYVFVEAKTGTEKSLVDALFEIPEVLEAHTIVGDYDILVVLGAQEETPTRFPAARVIGVLTDKIRKMENVEDTTTVIPVRSQFKKSRITDPETWAKGFVCIKVRVGRENQVMQELLRIEDAAEAHIITGEHDLLAVLEVRKTVLPPRYPEMITKIVIDKIRRINGVEDTETFIPDSSKIKTM